MVSTASARYNLIFYFSLLFLTPQFNQFNQTNPPPTVNLQKQAEIAQGPPLSAPKTPISTLPTNARTPNTTLAQNPLAAISNVAASSSSMSSFHLWAGVMCVFCYFAFHFLGRG